MRRRMLMLLMLMTVAVAWSSSGRPETARAQEGGQKTHHFTLPFLFILNTCEETVEVTGEQEVAVHQSVDARGGRHVSAHFVTHATGVGQLSEDRYIFRDGFQTISNNGPIGCPSTITETGHSTLIRQGPDGEDSRGAIAHITTHITLNANCELTAQVSNFDIECPGPEGRP